MLALAASGRTSGLLFRLQLLVTVDALIVVCILHQLDVLGIGRILEFAPGHDSPQWYNL